MPDLTRWSTDALSPGTQQTLEAMGHRFKVPGNAAQGGRGSSHVWGNLQTVEWDKATNTLMGGSDPRNPVGAAKVVESAPSR